MLAIRLAAVVLAVSSPMFTAAGQEPGIHGLWWTKGKKGRVEIADCGQAGKGLCGKIVWISQPMTSKGSRRPTKPTGP